MSTTNPIGNADTPATVLGVGENTDEAPTRWRSLAVARSVDPAREAAEDRVQRLIDAALELMTNPDGDEVTVQNVADRAGLSLRAFYRHFPSKDELLLAVFEEAIRANAQHLQQEIAASDEPLERVRIFATEYYRSCRSGQTRHAEQAPPRSKARPVRVPAAVRPPRRGRAHVHPPRVAPPPPPRRRNGGRCHPGGPRQ